MQIFPFDQEPTHPQTGGPSPHARTFLCALTALFSIVQQHTTKGFSDLSPGLASPPNYFFLTVLADALPLPN